MPDVIQIAIQAVDNASKIIGGVGTSLDKLGGSADNAEKKMRLFGLSTEQIGAKMTQAGKIATVGLTLPIAGLAVAATKAASDLNETSTKIETLFGNASDSIKKFSDTAATSLGQSKKQALDAAADFAIFGRAAGLAGEDLVDFSKQNVKLAADFASFFNTSPDEAITAIGAAFRGESEPIRRYGVLINEASLKDEALRLGLIKTTTEALQPQARVLAAQALILKQTSAAQGDFERTSAGLANQQRILNAQFQDALATLGQSLLPVVIKVAGAANDLLKAFNDLDPAQKDLIVGFGLMAAAAGPVLTVGGKLIGVFGSIGSVAVDAAGGFIAFSKNIGETAGYLKQVGVSAESLKFAFQNLKAAGAVLAVELGVIVAGLIAIGKYLEQVSVAAQATNEDLLAMSKSGDIFKQAAATTEILTNGQNRLKVALDGVNTQLQTSAVSYADYRSSLEATAKAAGFEINAAGDLIQVYYGMSGRTEKLIQQNYLLAEGNFQVAQSQRVAAEGVVAYADALDEGTRVSQRFSEAQRIEGATYGEVNVALASRNETTQAYVEQLGAQMRASEEATAAEATHRASLLASVTTNEKLAQSIAKATDAQAVQTLAQAQLDTLKKAYEEGKISAEGFEKATNAVLLRYDLATPKSIAMAEATQKINEAFLAGKIPLDQYITATGKIPKIAADGKVTLQELTNIGIRPTTFAVGQQEITVNDLTNAWAKVPANVKTVYTIETIGSIPGGGGGNVPGAQYGADFIVPSNPRGGMGDYFPVIAAPGERVIVQPRAQQNGPIAAGDTYNYTTNVYNPLAAAMLADQQRRDRLARSNARMGVV